MFHKIYCNCIALLFLNVFIFSQDIQFKHITIENGLSQSTVNCIFQDSHGFMWFGTENGLNRYDGYAFTIFRHEPADTNSLSHSWIWDIFEDRQKNLWIATWQGLNKNNPAQNSFVRYLPDENNPHAISGTRPTSICEDTNGYLWIGTWGGGLNRFDPKNDLFIHFTHDSSDAGSLPSDYIRDYVDMIRILVRFKTMITGMDCIAMSLLPVPV
jgi:hypothetical protein